MAGENARFARALIRSLEHLGVDHAFVCPGSRSTPLVLAVEESAMETTVLHDERSAGFAALGAARASGRAALLVTTSGTAAAELLPALVEARQARVPLIALTADRPIELRDVGAPQAIDQQGLFANTVKWAHDMTATAMDQRRVASLAGRLTATAVDAPPGPVHANLRFGEPLYEPGAGTSPEPAPPRITAGNVTAPEQVIRDLTTELSRKRGLVVVGPQPDPRLPEAAAGFAEAAGWPIFADALSGLRAGPHDRSHVLDGGDGLAGAAWLDGNPPEVVVRIGAVPTSKPMWRWLEDNPEARQFVIDPAGWRDPTASAAMMIRSDPAVALAALAKTVESADDAWWTFWHEADLTASTAISAVLERHPMSEPAVARAVTRSIGDGDLWVGSSMPIRDVDAVLEGSDRDARLMGTRGANGIDGLFSCALGSAIASSRPTTALLGDHTALHDVGALSAIARLGPRLRAVVVNNDGGGIFHFLPQASDPAFERLFAAPHGVDLAEVAAAFGLAARDVADAPGLRAALDSAPGTPELVQVRSDRAENRRVHQEMRDEVAAALR